MSTRSSQNLFDLSGRVAVVTGGARGLGRAFTLGLASAGAKIACIGSRPDSPDLRASLPIPADQWLYLQADLADRAQRTGLIDRVVDHFGGIDILVNGAGVQHRDAAVDFPSDKWDHLLSLMLTAVMELSQQAARHMIPRKRGKIIQIASVCSFQGGWTIPAYVAAKHGVVGLTQALSNEWAAHNLQVNAIAPGYFDTDMCAAIVNDPVREPKIRERIPAGRWGVPEDLIGPLLFLASDASQYVSGHTLVVDGGWLGR